MSKSKQTTLIAFVLVIGFAFNTQAFADTYQIFNIGATFVGTIYGIDDSGTAVIAKFTCSPPSSCYEVFVDGVLSYQIATPPALNYDNGTSCATPAGLNSLGETVCNNGLVVFGSRYNSNGDPDGLYEGPYSDPQFIESSPSANADFINLNSVGDFTFSDGLTENNYVALDLTRRQTPEPTSFVLLGTGVLGLIGVARRNVSSPFIEESTLE